MVFTANPLDRAGARWRDAASLEAQMAAPECRFLPFWDLRALIDTSNSAAPAWVPREMVSQWLDDGATAVLLGLEDGAPRFAIDVVAETNPAKEGPLQGAGKFIDVRSIAPSLEAGQSGILAQARSLLDWHARHRFCAVCGHESEASDGGAARRCTNADCGAQHFPRTDPVVIMMVEWRDHCLLGRQKHFPPGMYSALAGFIDQGETIEEAVRREILEEAGIPCGAVRYVASQPWPFPSSLMIGCFAEALADTIEVDTAELEEARWVHRDELVEMVKRSESEEAPRMAHPLSLAHQLAVRWLAEKQG
jgi:NAD+ diphosphatase